MGLKKHHRDHAKDELLEMLWHLNEEKNLSLCALREKDPNDELAAELKQAIAGGVVTVGGDVLSFTAAGLAATRDIIRRHRLAERLIHDVLGEKENSNEAACEFEHILAPQLVDSICILLGHPRNCPHGKEIPEGACCRAAKDEIKSLVIPVTEMDVGASAKVASINTKDEPRMLKLLSMGITPGTEIRLHQKYPALVIEIDQSQIALENAIGDEITVWRPAGN